MSASTTAGTLSAEAASVDLQIFGRATLADYFEDMIIYRNLEPLDPQLPGLKAVANKIGLSDGHIPRKQEEEYAKAALWFLEHAQEERNASQPLKELIFVGDSIFNDGNSFKHMQQISGLKGSCFIANEESNKAATLQILSDTNLYCTNRWAGLGDWALWLREQGFHLDERTAVVVDIDKTALGAKGRNDTVIDQARLEGIYRTMDSVLGSDFDRDAFERQYSELNQAAYHCVTEDNQDYLAYMCLVLNTQIIGFDELVGEVQKGSIDNFEQFTRWVNTRLIINPLGSERLLQVHETVMMSVRMGDPTPFKRFRRQEFVTTVERMGHLPDNSSVDELLHSEITLNNELAELSLWLRERNCLLICMSDKPSEASCPDPYLADEWLPLHRVPTHLVGASIRPLLDMAGGNRDY